MMTKEEKVAYDDVIENWRYHINTRPSPDAKL
jgi:hypothetical protein